MWPFKKKKNITISPGEMVELTMQTAWRTDKDEVAIITKDGPVILDGKNECFIEITANNANSIKLQVIPDFKNKTLNLIEVIDCNSNKKFDNDPKLIFAGIRKRIVPGEDSNVSIDEYLDTWDKEIEKYGKRIKKNKRIRDIIIPFLTITIFWNTYIFITKDSIIRYINLLLIFVALCVAYMMWNLHDKICKDYEEYKDLRKKAFGTVKDT